MTIEPAVIRLAPCNRAASRIIDPLVAALEIVGLLKYLCHEANRGYVSIDGDLATMPKDLFGPLTPDDTDNGGSTDSTEITIADIEARADFLEDHDPEDYPSVLRITSESEAGRDVAAVLGRNLGLGDFGRSIE